MISDKYYINVYESDEDIVNNLALLNWMDKQVKEYKSGNLEERKVELLKNQFKKISEFDNNSWLLSLSKIVRFNNYIKEKYNIDCFINKIAPSKVNFINLLIALYNNENIIRNTVEKILPCEGQVINNKYMNDECWNRGFVINLLKSEGFSNNKENFIDDFNIVYFQDLIDSNEEFMKRWHDYNNDKSNLDIKKLKLLNRIKFDSKAS